MGWLLRPHPRLMELLQMPIKKRPRCTCPFSHKFVTAQPRSARIEPNVKNGAAPSSFVEPEEEARKRLSLLRISLLLPRSS